MQAPGQTLKVCVVAILSLAWLFASNHCAIASMMGGHAKGEHSCCAKEKSSKDPVPCAEKCCKGMSVPVPVAELFFAPDLTAVCFLSDVTPVLPQVIVSECLSGLSPPGRCGEFFVEYVLGRSQQPLAPPVFVA